ncbi:reverse transcriptase family protein [Exiguobacterium sp. SRB7LM]|uniref:reverse transcriptase family protein n=1 Tax=Exiguobacterium sp. SRB7LM TaxID=2608401 RepID=UPI0018C401B4|nr:reverse transcriptase family protein [Exiguobacterium sp. SRB7LM]MBG0918934.1 RNA-directed DNA polymerase [Exiguobacterium sp. SRB7LM]
MDYSSCKLYKIETKKSLSYILQTPKSSLKNVNLCYYPKVNIFNKNTSSGKVRTFYNPTGEHKKALRNINRSLSVLPIPPYVIGGIKKQSIISNASKHMSSRFFLSMDIKDFFNHVPQKYIYSFFKNDLKMSIDSAKICTTLVTYEIDNHSILPQGYPTSPILSYLTNKKMFDKISQLSSQNNIIFSLYVDDLTFSSPNPISKKFENEVRKILNFYSYKVNSSKTKRQYITKPVLITGVIINNGELLPQIKHTKQMIDYIHNIKSRDLHEVNIDSWGKKIRGYYYYHQAFESYSGIKFPQIKNFLGNYKK